MEILRTPVSKTAAYETRGVSYYRRLAATFLMASA